MALAACNTMEGLGKDIKKAGVRSRTRPTAMK
jgi:predicted small secreted protein